jgi:excinuclease ABC subunit C
VHRRCRPHRVRGVVEDVKALLEGRAAPVVARLRDAMADLARRQIRAGRQGPGPSAGRREAVRQRAGRHDHRAEDLDFLGYARAGEFAMVQLFRMRGGRVVGATSAS